VIHFLPANICRKASWLSPSPFEPFVVDSENVSLWLTKFGAWLVGSEAAAVFVELAYLDCFECPSPARGRDLPPIAALGTNVLFIPSPVSVPPFPMVSRAEAVGPVSVKPSSDSISVVPSYTIGSVDDRSNNFPAS
jgi:hypothetical protein